MENKTTEAQRQASRKWEEKNRSKATIDNYRRSARSFVRNHATFEDIEELKELIEERIKKLEEDI